MLRNLVTRVALVLAVAVTAPSAARAADQTILGNQLVVKNPSTPDKREVVVKAREAGSPDTIVGDPTVAGASLAITANGGTPSAQTFALPAGTSALTGKPFWSGDAVKGFKYKDSKGENGPVKVAAAEEVARRGLSDQGRCRRQARGHRRGAAQPRHGRLRAARGRGRRRHVPGPLRRGRAGDERRREAIQGREVDGRGALRTAADDHDHHHHHRADDHDDPTADYDHDHHRADDHDDPTADYDHDHHRADDHDDPAADYDHDHHRADDHDDPPACTFVLTWGSFGSGNGQFESPVGVATDGSGNVYVADTGNNRIQKFDASGTFLTTWGSCRLGQRAVP